MTKTRVLVVEDEAVVALHLRGCLERLGYHVVGEASTADQAVALARVHRPQVVLMDIGLKGAIDGIDAARELGARFSTPVVFVTGSADDLTMTRATAAAPFGFLLKPINERELQRVVELAVGRHREEQAGRRIERWLLLTLRAMTEAVTVVDEGGFVAFLNPAAERLTGWSMPEAIGREYVEVLARVDLGADASRAKVQAARASRHPTSLSPGATLRRRDGTFARVEGTLCPLAEDELSGVVQPGVVVVLRRAAGERPA